MAKVRGTLTSEMNATQRQRLIAGVPESTDQIVNALEIRLASGAVGQFHGTYLSLKTYQIKPQVAYDR